MTKRLGVVLAGGLATRMGGGDKGLLPLGERPLLDHVLERLAPQVDGIAINANGDPARFAAYRLPILPDTLEGFAGPLAGVLAGLQWAANQGADQIVTVAADTPFFPLDLVARLQEASRGMEHPLALAATPGRDRKLDRHPTFGLWPVSLAGDLRQSLEEGTRKVVLWTDKHGGRTAMFTSDDDPFFNVNTPEDLEEAQLRARDPA
ncbi:MAG: molybdenum cofactor guanylyltransferase MobA [Pseudomonadota bacterium]